MNVLQLICSDNFIAVNKTLIKAVGIESALLLGELASEAVYWRTQDKVENGYFYSTIENVEEKTTLTAYQQRKCLASLQEKGIVDVVSKKGTPPRRYISINEKAIAELFDLQMLKNFTFKNEKTEDSNIKKLDTNNNESSKKLEKENSSSYIAKTLEKLPYKSEEFITAVNNFLEMRKQKKKPIKTERAFTMMIKEAEKLSGGDEQVMAEIINQSTANEWLGVYPLRNKNSYNSGPKSGKNEFMEMLQQMEAEDDQEGSITDFSIVENGLPECTD